MLGSCFRTLAEPDISLQTGPTKSAACSSSCVREEVVCRQNQIYHCRPVPPRARPVPALASGRRLSAARTRHIIADRSHPEHGLFQLLRQGGGCLPPEPDISLQTGPTKSAACSSSCVREEVVCRQNQTYHCRPVPPGAWPVPALASGRRLSVARTRHIIADRSHQERGLFQLLPR